MGTWDPTKRDLVVPGDNTNRPIDVKTRLLGRSERRPRRPSGYTPIVGTKIVNPGPQTRKSSHGHDRAAASGSMQLGDAVAVAAKPIARALGLPEDCEPCRRRQEFLNNLGSKTVSGIRRIFRR